MDNLRVLRTVARIIVPAGALGALGAIVYAGARINSPRIVLALLTVWVLSPFAAFRFAMVIADGWSHTLQNLIYGIIVVLTFAAIALYADSAFGPLRKKTGFVFVIVPLALWLITGVALAVGAAVGPRRPQ